MPTTSAIYNVPAISCEHCRGAIEAKVAPLHGVESVTVDVDAKEVTVRGGEPADIKAAIKAAGYDVA